MPGFENLAEGNSEKMLGSLSLARQGRYFYSGYSIDPEEMTDGAKDTLVNVLHYMRGMKDSETVPFVCKTRKILWVYTVLGIGDAALHHAQRCLDLTQAHADLMQDFDRAYAYEAVARANAVAGKRDVALQYVQLAQEAGEAIAGQEDKDYFLGDFNGGDWHGVR